MTTARSKPVGELNGKWALLLKVFLSTYPILLTWGVWVTSETFINRSFRNTGNRFTATDGASMKASVTKDCNDYTDERFAISHAAQRDHNAEAGCANKEVLVKLTVMEVNQATVQAKLDSIQKQLDRHFSDVTGEPMGRSGLVMLPFDWDRETYHDMQDRHE